MNATAQKTELSILDIINMYQTEGVSAKQQLEAQNLDAFFDKLNQNGTQFGGFLKVIFALAMEKAEADEIAKSTPAERVILLAEKTKTMIKLELERDENLSPQAQEHIYDDLIDNYKLGDTNARVQAQLAHMRDEIRSGNTINIDQLIETKPENFVHMFTSTDGEITIEVSIDGEYHGKHLSEDGLVVCEYNTNTLDTENDIEQIGANSFSQSPEAIQGFKDMIAFFESKPDDYLATPEEVEAHLENLRLEREAAPTQTPSVVPTVEPNTLTATAASG